MVTETQQKISSEEEIKKLEQQLEQKKRELAEANSAPHEEKEVFREVLKEHIESFKPHTSTLPPATHIPTPPATAPAIPLQHATVDDVKKMEEKEKIVRTLVEKAMTGTIENAVKEAQKISPYLLDELHDHLVDDFYEKLVALRKIKKL